VGGCQWRRRLDCAAGGWAGQRLLGSLWLVVPGARLCSCGWRHPSKLCVCDACVFCVQMGMGKTACAVGAIQLNRPPEDWRKNRSYQTLRARDHLCEWNREGAVLANPHCGKELQWVMQLLGATIQFGSCLPPFLLTCSLHRQQHAAWRDADHHAGLPCRAVVSHLPAWCPASSEEQLPAMPLLPARNKGRRLFCACVVMLNRQCGPPDAMCRENEIRKTTQADISILKWTEPKGRQARTEDCREIAQFDVVLTTFQLASTLHTLSHIRWWRIIVDEPQLNAGGFLADKDHTWFANHRWLLTGTPINATGGRGCGH
jgi:hypothetical protein